MSKQSPYHIVKHLYVTEKTSVLQGLCNAESNPSLRRCKNPKYTFIVDPRADKHSIANAVEEIYKEKGIKVISVNTMHVKGKKRRVRGHLGTRPGYKKAIVTLQEGDLLENL